METKTKTCITPALLYFEPYPNHQRTAAFSPCFHLTRASFGYIFLTHSHVESWLDNSLWLGRGTSTSAWPSAPASPPEASPPAPSQASELSAQAWAEQSDLAVAQKTRYQNGTLVSGNIDQRLHDPSCIILSPTHLMALENPCSNKPPETQGKRPVLEKNDG